MKGQIYIPTLPTSLEDLKQGITEVLENVMQDMLQCVWQMSYQLDMCHVKGRAHIEHLRSFVESVIKYPFFEYLVQILINKFFIVQRGAYLILFA